MTRVAAIDVGTSGCRVGILEGPAGAIARLATREYRPQQRGVRAEIDPGTIATSLAEALAQVAGDVAPEKIALGTFMHSLLLLDESFRPITKLLLWSDTRARGQCEELRRRYSEESWHEQTGCILSPIYPLYKLLWFAREDPATLANARFVCSIQAYLIYLLTGRLAEERSSAISMGWCNLSGQAEPSLLAAIDRKGLNLAEPVKATEPMPLSPPAGSIFLKLARGWQSTNASRVHAAGTDGPLAHLGSAGTSPNLVSLTVGTSSAVRILEGAEQRRLTANVWRVPLLGATLRGSASNNGANVLEALLPDYAADLWQRAKTQAEPTATVAAALIQRALSARFDRTLFFSPCVVEERHLDAARGAFWQAGENHAPTANDFLRAALEGLVFAAVSMYEELSQGATPQGVLLSGGLATAPPVCDLIARLLSVPVFLSQNPNPALLGAAVHCFPDQFDAPRDRPVADRLIPLAYLADLDYEGKYRGWKEWMRKGPPGESKGAPGGPTFPLRPPTGISLGDEE